MIILKWLNLLWATVKAVLIAPVLILPMWWLCLLVIVNLPAIIRGWRLTMPHKVKA